MRNINYTHEDESLGEVTLEVFYNINPYNKIANGVEIMTIKEGGLEIEIDRSLLLEIKEYILENDEDDISSEFYDDES